jgi:hypothetical protein
MLLTVKRWKKASVTKYGVNNPRSRLEIIIIIIIIITTITTITAATTTTTTTTNCN